MLPIQLRTVFVAIASTLLITTFSQKSRAQGTDYYWNVKTIGVNNDGNWNAAGIWYLLPTGGPTLYTWTNNGTEIANFGRNTATVTLTDDQTAYQVNFLDVNGYVISGLTLTLSNSAGGTGIINTNSFSATINSQILGSVGMNKNGTGILTLTNANSYTGVTHINAGALSISNGSALGTIGVSNNTVVSSGAALQISGGITVAELLTLNGTGLSGAGALQSKSGANTYSGAITLGSASRINTDAGTLSITGGITGAQNLTIGGAGNTTVNSVIGTGAGTLTKDGAGTVTLSSNNTYSGSTTISGGVLSVSNLQNGGTTSNLGTGTSIVLDGGTLLYTGATQSIDRAFTLTNNAGTINASGTGPITFANTGAVTMTGTNARTLTFTGTAGTTAAPNVFAGGIVDSTGATSVTKTGTGTWYLSGTNTYTGATTVNAGTLLVNGSTGSSTLTVNSSGTLAGTGTIGGPVVVNSGGFIAPGNGTIPLTVNNTVTINGTMIISIDVGANTNSRLLSKGLTLNNANLTINFSGTLTGTEEFVIAQNVTPGTTAVTGTFNGIANRSQIGTYDGKAMYIYYDSRLSGIDIISESGTIILTPVPEPVSVVSITALALGVAGVIRRRRALATKNAELAA